MKNFFKNPQIRTITNARTIYDRKQAGETLESIRAELQLSRVECSRLYNWYKKIYKKKAEKGGK